MRNIGRKLLTASLAALYSGIALLGHGLHEFAPHQFHHATAHTPSHAGCSHAHHQHSPIPETPSFSDSHECDVCAFLDQHLSNCPQLTAKVYWQPTITRVDATTPQAALILSFGPAAPRGPPNFIA